MVNKYFIYTLSLIFTLNISAMEKSPELNLSLINAIKKKDQALALQIIKTHDVNARDADGMTALMHAAHKGYTNLVKVLVASGATINAKDISGMTPLMWAAEKGRRKVVKRLIGAGADVNAQNSSLETALMNAAYKGLTEVVKELIDAGARVEAQDEDGKTALMWAAYGRDTEIVKKLIAAGANVNTQCFVGETPLMGAAEGGNIKMVTFLIAVGADMNIQEADGSTALMLAAKNKQKKAIKTLIAAGAQYNDTLPNYAEYQAFAAQIKEFFACAVDLSIPYYASSTGPNLKPDTLRRINELIKTHKLSLDYIDPQGNTLLHYAVLSGNRVAVSLMLYLMMKHNQCYALDHRARQSGMTPVEMAVTSRAAHLLHPFFNLKLPNKS